MADFFEELGKRISDVASDLGKKTEDTRCCQDTDATEHVSF